MQTFVEGIEWHHKKESVRLPFKGNNLWRTAMKNAPLFWSWGTILMDRCSGNFELTMFEVQTKILLGLIETPSMSWLAFFVSSMLIFLEKLLILSLFTSTSPHTVWLSSVLLLAGNMLGNTTFFLLCGTSSWLWNQDSRSCTCRSQKRNHWDNQNRRIRFSPRSLLHCQVGTNCLTKTLKWKKGLF